MEDVDGKSSDQINLEDLIEKAHNGVVPDQLALGKHLLNNTDKTNVAVGWLALAAEQCNEEAIEILTECLANGKGINDENREEIEWLVNSSPNEKSARRAAKKLFKTFNQSSDDDVDGDESGISSKYDKDPVDEVNFNTDDSKEGLDCLLSASGKSKDKVTPEELVETALRYVKGEVPDLVVTLSDEEMEKYNKASYLEKCIKYPRQSFESLKHYVLVTASKNGTTWLKNLIPTSQLQTLFLLFIYSQLTTDMFWFFIPLIIFYLSFLSMLIFSLQMLYGSQIMNQINNVTLLLKRIDPLVDSRETETKFLWKSRRPYIMFLVSLFIMILALPLSSPQWIPSSELCVLSVFMTVVSYRGNLAQRWTLVILLLRFISYQVHSLKDYPVLWILSYPVFVMNVPYLGFQVLLGFHTIIQLWIIGTLAMMVDLKSVANSLRIITPCVVCLLWGQVSMEFFQSSTWSGLTRATFGWLTLMTIFPLVLITTAGVTLGYGFQWFLSANVGIQLASTAVVILITTALIYYEKIKLPSKKLQSKPILIITAVCSICFLVPFFYVTVFQSREPISSPLSWDEYAMHCGSASWADGNQARAQTHCGMLSGEIVNWNGTVKSVKVQKTGNKIKAVISTMPRWIRNFAACVLGETLRFGKYDAVDKNEGTMFAERKFCTLDKFNKYTFTLIVNMTSQDIALSAGHGFASTLVNLKAGMKINFKGTLMSGLGTSFPTLTLKSLGYNSKEVKPKPALDQQEIRDALMSAGSYSLQFFFGPSLSRSAEAEYDVS